MARYEDLTFKQRVLIDELLKGTPKVEAYKKAYPNSKLKNTAREVDRMIDNDGGKFPSFSLVYKELKQEAYNKLQEQKKASIATKTDLLAFLSDVASGKEADYFVTKDGDEVKTHANLTVRIKATDSLLKEINAITETDNSKDNENFKQAIIEAAERRKKQGDNHDGP